MGVVTSIWGAARGGVEDGWKGARGGVDDGWEGARESVKDAWESTDGDIWGDVGVDESTDENVDIDPDDIVGMNIDVGAHTGAGIRSLAFNLDTEICGRKEGASTDVWSTQQQ